MTPHPRTERQTWLLAYIEQHGFITAPLAGRLLRIGTRDARQSLRTLVKQGELSVDEDQLPARYQQPTNVTDGQPIQIHKSAGAWSVDHAVGPASIFSMGGQP